MNTSCSKSTDRLGRRRALACVTLATAACVAACRSAAFPAHSRQTTRGAAAETAPPATTDQPTPPPVAPPMQEDAHPADILEFATAVVRALSDADASPPVSNTYSHETAYRASLLPEPRIALAPSDELSLLASTDCSGWVSFVVNAVSPLHHAVLQSQRHLPAYNRSYEDGLVLEEGQRAWARAFVLTNFFRAPHASLTGFKRLLSHAGVRYGDLVAYSMGRYVDPTNAALQKPPDTGHTFIIAGSPTVVDPSTPGYDGSGTLSERAAQVLAVPVIDSSSVPHFNPDTRATAQGAFSLPEYIPDARVKAGGIGIGTAWFALDANERVIQRRLGPTSTYRNVVISAVRLNNVITLVPEVLNADGELVVDVFDNVPTEYAGASYGDLPVSISGEGGIRLISGRLTLSGPSNFTGGVTVESGELVVASETALGVGNVDVQGGTLRMQQPALPDSATLRLSPAVEEGAVRLDFDDQDILQSLQIGHTEYRCGRWGSPESGAAFKDARFSGPGVLLLTAEPGSQCQGPSPTQAQARGVDDRP